MDTISTCSVEKCNKAGAQIMWSYCWGNWTLLLTTQKFKLRDNKETSFHMMKQSSTSIIFWISYAIFTSCCWAIMCSFTYNQQHLKKTNKFPAHVSTTAPKSIRVFMLSHILKHKNVFALDNKIVKLRHTHYFQGKHLHKIVQALNSKILFTFMLFLN